LNKTTLFGIRGLTENHTMENNTKSTDNNPS